MAACSAADEYLPPMVVLQEQHVQSTWKPNIKDNDLFPWIYCNKSVWMDSGMFYKWFEEFEKTTRRYKEVSACYATMNFRVNFEMILLIIYLIICLLLIVSRFCSAVGQPL